MCLLLLVSTSGVAYAQHFCGDFEMLSTLTLGEEKLSCDMVNLEDDACRDEKSENHSCCDNQYTKVTIDDNFHASQDTFQVPANFTAAFVSVFVLHIETSEIKTSELFSAYNPPPLIKNFPVLYETFLI